MARFLRRSAALVWVGLFASAVAAQPSPCPASLLAAEAAYHEAAYASVEPHVLGCVYHPAATQGERVAAYRLLALALIKQDRLAEAGEAVVKLLGVDYAYDADLTTDLPLYVGLVNATKRQLRVRAPAPPRPPAPVAAPGAGRRPPVDPNTATVEALDTVPGIGPAIAGRIVAYRSQNGPFRSVADLVAVRGIGPRTLARMAPYLQVGPAGQAVSLGVQAYGGASAAPVPDAAADAGAAALVNLNTATAEELDALDGIGPALAARIVAFREAHGPFQSAGDVVQVRGIGPRTFEGFAHRVTVE